MECGSSKMNTCNFSPAPQPKTDQDEGGTRIPVSTFQTPPRWDAHAGRRKNHVEKSGQLSPGCSGVVRGLGPSWSGPMVRANPMANEGKNGMLAVKSPVS